MSGKAASAEEINPGLERGQASAVSSLLATVPFTLDHNRMIVDVEFVSPDGTTRKARAWVDTGSQYLTLAEPLARDLGMDLPERLEGEHSVEVPVPPPSMLLSGVPLRTEGVGIRVHPGALVRPGVAAESNLPASILKNYHVVFDYAAHHVTIAPPGVMKPKGIEIPCQINAETGLFMIAAVIDGDTLQFGVDNGSAGTWVSNTLIAEWKARHPDWPHATGAAGSANFFGFPFESDGVLMSLPELRLGSLGAQNVALLGLDQSLFDWYSKKSANPVVGFIGANVLRNFRFEIDFASSMTYWEPVPPPEPTDLNIVGLTLRPELDGRLSIASVVKREGRPTVEGIQPGDRLVRVDSLEVANATMGSVANALRGTPGSTRTIVIERNGTEVTVETHVLQLP